VTCNEASQIDKYQIPKVNKIFAKVAGGKIFSKVDFSEAYSQIPLEEKSLKYLTVNPHKSLFRVTISS